MSTLTEGGRRGGGEGGLTDTLLVTGPSLETAERGEAERGEAKRGRSGPVHSAAQGLSPSMGVAFREEMSTLVICSTRGLAQGLSSKTCLQRKRCWKTTTKEFALIFLIFRAFILSSSFKKLRLHKSALNLN